MDNIKKIKKEKEESFNELLHYKEENNKLLKKNDNIIDEKNQKEQSLELINKYLFSK